MFFLTKLKIKFFGLWVLSRYENYYDTSYIEEISSKGYPSHILYYINPITGERKSKLCAFEGFVTEAEFQMMRKPNLELWQEYEMSRKLTQLK